MTTVSLIVFPFYVIVYRSMREKEKQTAVFPIIDHFYRATICTYFLFSVCVPIDFFAEKILSLSYYIINPWINYLFMVYIEVHLTILSLLAIQRFFLYFFPSHEKYISFTSRTTNYMLLFLYLLIFLESIAQKIYAKIHRDFIRIKLDDGGLILIDIHERSTVTLLAGVAFSIILGTETYGMFDPRFALFGGPKPQKLIIGIETITTPFLIQIFYLLCNRANVMQLRKQITIRKLFRRMVDCVLRNNRARPVEVAPDMHVDDLRTTVV
ncbi:hypothetical protein CAEBREN_08710 [Caenorhabditis brenneri]|uniref:Uncharacterized protein n=1 Tax=Caenorhabditis brenneri TaxID=135651 RepID=G0N349_CAEBE|nr:hypothetical protein CAEBREN_08710 [Caenorhabditis brenneri]